MEKIIDLWKKYSFIRYALVFIAGCALFFFFMQTKIIEKEVTIKKLTEISETQKGEINKLTTQNFALNQKIKSKWFKTTLPDGTIYEGTSFESDTSILASLEEKLKETYEKKYNEKVAELEKKYEKETINPKTITVVGAFGIGRQSFTGDFLLKAKVWGPVGIVWGFGLTYNRPDILGVPDFKKADLIGKAGVSLDM